jgi:hypothetical protein
VLALEHQLSTVITCLLSDSKIFIKEQKKFMVYLCIYYFGGWVEGIGQLRSMCSRATKSCN